MSFVNKTFLITEIDDFIGLRAAQMAKQQGMKVRGLLSSSAKIEEIEALGIEIFSGSVTDKDALAIATEGVDIVFHTATVKQEAGSLEHFRQVNVAGTINAAKAAKQAGVKTFVHLSSTLVYGFKYPEQVTETQALSKQNNPFCQSKIESEKEVLKFNSPDFGVIILRAGDVYGPGAVTWVLRPLQLMQQKKFVLIDGGKGINNHVYVDNLIDSVFLAIENEAYGEVFNITDGYSTTWKDYYTKLGAVTGLGKPTVSMPAFLVKLAIQRQGKEAAMKPEAIDFVTRPHTYSIAKARQVLGYEPRISLDEGMAKTAAWLRENNFLQPVSVGN
jgi:nucleoside-diphosphate-sugar epimerase